MGKYIEQTEFTAQDFQRYRERLRENLKALKTLLAQPEFGRGSPSYGAELELYIIDKQGAAKPINIDLQSLVNDKQLTLELNRFNLEYNFTPVAQDKAPFTKIKEQMVDVLSGLSDYAKKMQARILPIGILPTLQAQDLGLKALTDIPRYHLLAKTLRRKRGSDFHLQISGEDALDLHWPDVSAEGAATSFQFHYRVNPEDFADAYNAAQLTMPLVLALSANSPFFLGRKLWQETRIPLFKQATDCRTQYALDNHFPARVYYGLGWIRKDIYELFAEGVSLFEPVMPVCYHDDPFDQLSSGQAPSLSELRLHLGSIWNWNRPIYDPHDNGHLRIELRSLPAGPTPKNMLASAALMSGLMRGLQGHLSNILPAIPFYYARKNFYRAAKYGLKACLFWPDLKTGDLQERPVIGILKDLLPCAQDGLYQLGIAETEITEQMDIINAGLESRMNGAQWQINVFDKLIQKEDRNTALTQLVELYYKQYQSGKAVHEWSEKI
ncbi:MAG: gamma-glutamyl:cysteine ligase YbdK (ATP-grasp superfamily) [Psychromonas sp.]|uniref:glutamate-cysteine ligase family protein n=1 Tax=Psychromonas sp. TaxID=1884585 RepID=UPI0039E4066D